MKELNVFEADKVAGGIFPPFVLGPTYTPDESKSDVSGIDRPVIFDPGTPIVMGQKTDITNDPANHLYPPLGRPLPFPQDRR